MHDFQGLNAIDAAVHKGLTHVVFNGSENIKKSIGKECAHLDSKAAIEEYLREVGVNYTILRLPFWYENFLTVFRPHKVKHGVYAIGRYKLLQLPQCFDNYLAERERERDCLNLFVLLVCVTR